MVKLTYVYYWYPYSGYQQKISIIFLKLTLTAFTFVLMAQMFFAKTIKFSQCSHEDFSFGSFQESIFFNSTQKGEIIIIAQSFVFRKA